MGCPPAFDAVVCCAKPAKVDPAKTSAKSAVQVANLTEAVSDLIFILFSQALHATQSFFTISFSTGSCQRLYQGSAAWLQFSQMSKSGRIVANAKPLSWIF